MLSPKEKNKTSFVTNCIAHHGVLNINKPDHVGVIFDASANIKKTCLNNNILPGIDVEKMFQQVFADPKDYLLPFRWRDNPENPLSDCQMNIQLFGKS